jgi:hypothetical protein
VLERNKKPQLSEGMQAALKDMGKAKTIALAISLKELASRPEAQAAAQQYPQAQQFVGELESLIVQIGVASDIDVAATVNMKTDKSADELRKMFDGFLTLAKFAGGKDMPQEAFEILESIKFEAKGTKMNGTMQLKTASLVKLGKDTAAKKGLPF